MSTDELREKWVRIEGLLRDSLVTFRKELTSDRADVVAEYLDHNELGLAADLLRDTVSLPNETLMRAIELMALD